MAQVGIGVYAEITQAQNRIRQLERRIQRFEKNAGGGLVNFGKKGNQALSGVMQSMTALRGGTAGAALGVSLFVRSSLREFASFEKAFAEVTTLIPQASGAMVAGLEDDLRAMAITYGQEIGNMTRAAYEAISAGVPGDEASTFIEVATDAALGGVTDITTAVDGLTTVLNAYSLSMDDARHVSDIFFTAVRLGKCVTGDTRVLLADGTYRRIDELADGATVVSFDGRGFVPMRAEWVDQGVKPTVTVTTRLGRRIKTTWTHPYLTENGWRQVKDLSVGDKIAVPTHLPYHGTQSVPEHESGLLGLWLAEGSTRSSSPRITSNRYGDQITAWAKEWGCATANDEHREGKSPVWRMSAGSRGGGRRNPILDWLRRLGLGDVTSATKHIPDEVFGWDRESQATLLRWLFNGDGWLADLRKYKDVGANGFQVGFCSKSERLVRDVSHLLLRFGIVGRVRHRPGWANCWVWEINRYREVRRFVDLVGIDRPAAERVADHEPAKQRAMWGVVEYDRIISIEAGPEEPVYDLCVPGLHNFVAEDIVAHNTTFPLLAYNIAKVLPIAESMGIGWDQIAAGMAALTAQGRPTAEASTQIRAFLDQLSDSATKTGRLFVDLAGMKLPEFIRQGSTIFEAAELVVAGARQKGLEVAEVFGRVEGATGALGLATETAERVAVDALGEVEGASIKAAETMKETFQFELDQVKAMWSDLKISMAEPIVPIIKPVLEISKDVAEFMQFAIDPDDWLASHAAEKRDRTQQAVDASNVNAAIGRGDSSVFGADVRFDDQGRQIVSPEQQAVLDKALNLALQRHAMDSYTAPMGHGMLGNFSAIVENEERKRRQAEYRAVGGVGAQGPRGITALEVQIDPMQALLTAGREAAERLAADAARQAEQDRRTMWRLQDASYMANVTGPDEYLQQLHDRLEHVGLATTEGISVARTIRSVVSQHDETPEDNTFWVVLRGDDQPDRIIRAQRGPIRSRPTGACG